MKIHSKDNKSVWHLLRLNQFIAYPVFNGCFSFHKLSIAVRYLNIASTDLEYIKFSGSQCVNC